MGSKSF